MSQTPETPATPATPTPEDFLKQENAAKRHVQARGLDAGPRYLDQGNPTLWHQQIFFEGQEPTGTITPEQALRGGSHANAIDIALIGSATNAADVAVPEGGTITFTFVCADSEDGPFTTAGPSICVTAPAGGMKASPGEALYRFCLPWLPKPWVKCVTTFTGSITGGNLDCGLVYMPR